MADSAAFESIVCVVGFHHARGPEIECWIGVEDGRDPAVENDWSLLPFMALSDGAHACTEDFSYFTLRRTPTETTPATSLFGISCTRQLESAQLLVRPDEVTRSTVQKSVVVVAQSPHNFGMLREKLSMVTRAWFAQKDFAETQILIEFQESLISLQEDDADPYLGISLRELIHEFKHQTLVLFKCCLLQPKMLFFGSKCERLCMVQFALISLIPGLIRRLEDCADPEMDSYEKTLVEPTTLKSSERSSLLSYMGLPIQLFGKGSLFGPYTPLQQLDMLADHDTKSYIVGSTNSLLLQQRDRYSDVLVNLDETTVAISSPSLRTALALTSADRRWIDFLHQTILNNWDPENPSRPRTHGYLGSEEFIRLQFEEYLLALLSATKFHLYLSGSGHQLSGFDEPDPSLDFGEAWIDAWKRTHNFHIWNTHTGNLFDIVEPKHPTAGGLSMDDINRRLTQQIQDLHLDERLASSRDVLNRHLVTGQKKVTSVFNNLLADIETLRESQRSRRTLGAGGTLLSPLKSSHVAAARLSTPTTPQAGAYLASWGSWVTEKKRAWL